MVEDFSAAIERHGLTAIGVGMWYHSDGSVTTWPGNAKRPIYWGAARHPDVISAASQEAALKKLACLAL